MKKFATLALLAVIAYAQDEPVEEAPAEEVAAEEPAEEVVVEEEATPLPLPDQAVATDIAFTFNVSRVVDSQISQLSDTTDPPAPEPQGVTGTITALTDAAGVGSISVDLKGYWAAKFQNNNSSKDLVGNMALEFRQNTTVTTTGQDEQGNATESTSQVVKAETIVMTGSKTDAVDGSEKVQQWDTSSISFAGGWDYQTPISEFLGSSPTEITTWTDLGGSFIDNGEAGSSKYWLGFEMTGSRPFEGSVVNFENKGTTTVTGATWVTKKGKREFNRGTMTYTVDLAMPVVKDDEPVDNTGDGGKTGGQTTGASALSAATAAAVAVLALAF